MRLRVLFLGLAMLATPARAADRNVVFFVADDHGTEALGAYGNRVAKTPSLDQLALDGVRFTHAFATTASCSASRYPLESANLAADPKHAHVLADLKARIKAFRDRTGDPWVIKWRYE